LLSKDLLSRDLTSLRARLAAAIDHAARERQMVDVDAETNRLVALYPAGLPLSASDLRNELVGLATARGVAVMPRWPRMNAVRREDRR
jgi:hypothetical protein